MVEFKIDKKVFLNLLEKCSMNGSVQFRDGKAINKPFFSSFYLDINPKNRIEMLAMDTVRKKTTSNIMLEGVEVKENGVIPIMDFESIKKCLTGKGLDGEITVKTRDSTLILETASDFYSITQRDNPDIKNMKKKEIIKKLEAWKKMHKFDGDDGMLVLHHPKKDVVYSMRIEVDKEDLVKVVGDTLSITKDNKTRLVFKDGVFNAYKGEANARIKSGHKIKYSNTGLDLIDFDEEFYSLQTIFPNLFEKIEFNIRRTVDDGTIKIFVRSIDEKSKIEIRIGIASIVKKGD